MARKEGEIMFKIEAKASGGRVTTGKEIMFSVENNGVEINLNSITSGIDISISPGNIVRADVRIFVGTLKLK